MGNNGKVTGGRVVRAVLAAGTVLVLAAGCTQTDSGTPSTSGLRGSTGPAPTSASLPTALPTLGGARGTKTAMCRDFRNAGGQLNKVGQRGRYAADLWRKLAADAPPEIRPATRAVAKFVTDAANGHPDLSSVSEVMTALGKVTDWASRNCI